MTVIDPLLAFALHACGWTLSVYVAWRVFSRGSAFDWLSIVAFVLFAATTGFTADTFVDLRRPEGEIVAASMLAANGLTLVSIIREERKKGGQLK